MRRRLSICPRGNIDRKQEGDPLPMSDNKKKDTKAANTEQEKEKVVTKYDLKVQRRKEEKEREKRQERISTVIGILVVVALVCIVASFPLRTYMATHETYVIVGGEKVTRVEFEYNYNLASGNYITENAYFLYMFGLDPSSDFSAQMYSDTLTWGDFFAQLAVERIIENKALMAEVRAAGFTYDTTEEYDNFVQEIKESAAEAGVSVKEYVQLLYGTYATLDRVSGYIKDAMVLNAYYDQVSQEKAPSDAEIEAYYQENTINYDQVDYRVLFFDAELPTEPTELADTSTEGASAADGVSTGETESTAYQPSEAEIAKAMADAKVLADAAEATVATEGTFTEGIKSAGLNIAVRDWLFDDARKQGDTTVIEDSVNHRYYVLAFEKRYLDTTPSADVRVLITSTENGQELLDAWAAGEATEESFAQMCRDHSEDEESVADGGLYEALIDTGMDASLSDWIYNDSRKAGDTVAITEEDGTSFVFYYIGTNEPEYKMNIRSLLLYNVMEEYLDEISQGIEVEDPENRLAYLHVVEIPSAEEDGTAVSREGETEPSEVSTQQ